MKNKLLFIVLLVAKSYSGLVLEKLQFNRAGVLLLIEQVEKHPRTQKKEKIIYAILTRESRGKDKGTYDAFSGGREKDQTPIQTAAMEFWQEAMLKDTLKWSQQKTEKYIEPKNGNTELILVTNFGSEIPKHTILFITRLPKKESQKVLKKFYTALNNNKDPEFTEKDRIGMVKWDELKAAIKNSPSSNVKVIGYIIDPKTNKIIPKIVTLRSILVKELRGFCKDWDYTTGKNPKIRLF